MRVLHISNYRRRGGGTAVARQLAAADPEKSVLLFLEQEAIRQGPEGHPTPEYACHWTDIGFVLGVVREALTREETLVVHCHGRRSGVHGRILRALHPKRIRVAMSFHGIASFRPPKLWITTLQEVLLAPWTDQFVAAAPAEVDLFKAFRMSRAIRTIPNAFNPDFVVSWSPRPVRRLGMCARFEPPKLHEDLIRLVAAYNAQAGSPITLVFAGDGSRRARADSLGTRLLGDKYVSLGHIPDIRVFYAQIDAFALFSEHEGLPLSLIDALACGLPCLATDVIGCRDVPENDVSGLLVPVGNTEAGIGALRRIAENPTEAARLAAGARRRALAAFSPEGFCRAYREVYESLEQSMRFPKG